MTCVLALGGHLVELIAGGGRDIPTKMVGTAFQLSLFLSSLVNWDLSK